MIAVDTTAEYSDKYRMHVPEPPKPIAPGLRDQFFLDPNLTFLNHGSFGSVPRPVFEVHNDWRRRIEIDPIDLIVRQRPQLLEASKQAVAQFLGMNANDFGLVTNATEGINCVLRSLDFSPGDELLTTSHVYNAVRQAMKYVCRRSGAAYRELDIPLPVASPESIADTVIRALSPRTKLLIVDHITSPTALLFPIERITAACKSRSIDILIDGAHGPGMVPININHLSPTYYAGNLHKWADCPKGCAFLWIHPDRQSQIHPMVISHFLDQGMLAEFGWQGTRDFAAWYAIPAALEFMSNIGWPKIMSHNHALATWVQQMLCSRWNVEPISPLDGSLLGAMATVPLPPPLDKLSDADGQALQKRLHDEFRIEVPTMSLNGRTYIRPCCQIYNTPEDFLRLADAIEKLAR
jgi:isopenicillin-N epimerase